ncbi:MAG: uracil phosphoribosyltransferase [Bacteroidetes bacterium]|nr:uracil phosphoribosyltransferase [Bacteroidota bacterium]MBV6461037.1 Uracil phosphoribosyltransferase [Flavobacteriales bacterium]WKZ75565.1 MAG: uracil phosphoribosyltransferase [Vicingaceae bacterium]MCL4815131.1 uracil phosphoribosyltransferase [Flavobacteriales bacterium]NOG94473.1 uracil phosphoribosyltransferase [Bacteroidota bacterium]
MATINQLNRTNSLLNVFIAEIRDIKIQQDSLRFRRNLERIGEVAALEISKTLTYIPQIVTTPLGEASTFVLSEQPVIASILRAGLPLHTGLLNYFDHAENAFISAYRKHHKDGSFDIELGYMASPKLENKTVILCDPMLASGSSIVLTYKALLKLGTPKHLHIVSVIASVEGLEYAKRHLPLDTTLWIGAIDDELTAQSYIVPGLGDAGDLAFGSKDQS